MDKYLLFNTINQTLVELNRNEINELKNAVLSNIHNTESVLLKNLKKSGLFSKKQLIDKKNCRIVIVPTLECNKNCRYCYHGGNQNLFIKKNSESILISYVKKFIKEKSTSKVSIIWHGGEPTIKMNQILIISNEIKKFANENNIILEESLLTNGIKLNEKLSLIQKTNINEIQISIDDSTSNRQFSEIKTFCKRYINCNNQVFVKYNIENSTDENILKIIDELGNLKFKDHLYFRLGFIEPHGNKNEIIKKSLSYTEFIKKYWSIADLLREKGLGWYPELPERIYSSCVANDPNSITIGPDLNLYRCNVTIPLNQWQISDLTNITKRNNRKAKDSFLKYNALNDIKCKKCKYVYLCLGGCPVKRIYNQRDEDYCKGTRLRIDLQIVDYYLNKQS